MSHDHIHKVLHRHWAYNQFRPLQEDIIRSVLAGRDTLALLPTGGGKSICFQVPAMAQEGICIVITPLIALMKDQVDQLERRRISAAAIFSGMPPKEIDKVLEQAVNGELKFLYCSPERLRNEMFRMRLPKMPVNLLAVDESHCISQWGYDFRPPYLKIAHIRPLMKNNPPVIALTATATPPVVEDIQNKLEFKTHNVFQKSFERKNLTYVVIHEEDKLMRLLRLVTNVPGTGIIYVRNRKKTREIALWLQNKNIPAGYYHAGLDQKIREKRQQEWMEGKIRIIVATNAFGMGIDKPNVRFVAHMDVPDNLEAYFQEAGRGGRDQKQSWAVLMYNKEDLLDAQRYFQWAYPPLETIKKVYDELGNFLKVPVGTGVNAAYDFEISQFVKTCNLHPVIAFNAIKFLEKEGYLILSDAIKNTSRVFISLNRNQLYEFQVRHAYYDPFIKILLRSYPGLFSGYVRINEYEISRRAAITVEKTQDILHKLSHMDVLDYQASSENPQLVFVGQRYHYRDLQISPETYQYRKEAARMRLEAIKDYVTSSTRCRSHILLDYFGEKNAPRCGKCDVCKERNKLNLSQYEFDLVLDRIKPAMLKEKITLQEMIKYADIEDHKKVMSVLSWLLDHNKVIKYGVYYAWNTREHQKEK